jgi:hypothetical protein
MFNPAYTKVEPQGHQPTAPAGYGAPAPQYGQHPVS